MGFCREQIGRISTESRRESFYIHDHPDDEDASHFYPKDEDPEIDYLVLEDLIAALIDLRDNDTRYRNWKSGRPIP